MYPEKRVNNGNGVYKHPKGNGASTSYEHQDIPVTPIPKKQSHNIDTPPPKKPQSGTPNNKQSTPNGKNRSQQYSFADSPHNTSFNPKSTIPYSKDFEKDTNIIINAMKSSNNSDGYKKQVHHQPMYNSGKKYTHQIPDKGYYVNEEEEEEEETNNEDIEDDQDNQNEDNTEYNQDDREYDQDTEGQGDEDGYDHHHQHYQQQHHNNNKQYYNGLNYTTNNSTKPLPKNIVNGSRFNGTGSSTPTNTNRPIIKYQSTPTTPNNNSNDEIIHNLKKKNQDLSNEIWNEKNNLFDKEERILDLEKQLDQANQNNSKLSKDLLSHKKIISQYEKKLIACSDTENDLQMNLKVIEANNQKLLKDNHNIMETNNYIQEQFNQLEMNYSMLMEEKKKLDKQLKRYKMDNESTNKSSNDYISNLKQEVVSLKNEIESKEKENENLENEIDQLKHDLDTQRLFTQKSQSHSGELQGIRKEFEKLKSENESSIKTIKDQELQLLKKSQSYEEMEKDLKKSLMTLEREKSKLEKDLVTKLEKSDHLLKVFDQQNRELKQQIESITLQTEQIPKLKIQIRDITEMNRRLNEEKKLQQVSFNKSLSSYEKQIQSLGTEDGVNKKGEELQRDLRLAISDLNLFQKTVKELAPKLFTELISKTNIDTTTPQNTTSTPLSSTSLPPTFTSSGGNPTSMGRGGRR